LKKVKLLEEIEKAIKSDGEDAFDADVAISTGELAKLIPELVEALGGEVEPKV
jgi:recombination associated protein RdgC